MVLHMAPLIDELTKPEKTQMCHKSLTSCYDNILQGALSGLLVSITMSTWIGIGAILSDIPVPTLPLSTDGCSVSVNENFTTIANIITLSTEESPLPRYSV